VVGRRHAAIASGGNAPAESVINTGGFYYLNPQAVTVDWWTVTDLYSKVAQATDDTARLAHLSAAIAASYGALAEDLDYEWLDTDREVVRRTRIKLHTHAAALHAADNPHQAWLLLDQACEFDPLSEDLACQAMRAAADTGDADAIRHRLKVLRDALDDAGIDLDQATETLAKDLLRNLQHPRRPE
jgi:two-component SAPR family response regulator